MALSDERISSGPIFELDREAIAGEYALQRPTYEALKQEIVFILEDRIASAGIKTHAIEARTKSVDSLLDKCVRKNSNNPFDDFVDLAAASVVCLFRADIDHIVKLVEDNFNVLDVDDKITTHNDPLNYQSVHLICRMKSGYAGPRYDKILEKKFEIQVRTLCMHCWAAVSHYVDYKGDWDVPANLKMSLNALSGLFYVADSQFEQFHAASLASKRLATEKTSFGSPVTEEINFDTVSAYLLRKFSDRKAGDRQIISELVNEMKTAGYKTISEVDRDIDRAAVALNHYERDLIGSERLSAKAFFFAAGAAARVSLAFASRSYLEACGTNFGGAALRMASFQKYVAQLSKPEVQVISK